MESRRRLRIVSSDLRTQVCAYLRKKGPEYWKMVERMVPIKSRLPSVSGGYKN
jgi:hypothetical protein